MTIRTAAEVAELCGATLQGDGSQTLRGPASLDVARPDEVSFMGHARYLKQLEKTAAGAVLVGLEQQVQREDLTLLRCADPSAAFTRVVEAFCPPPPSVEPGIHATAIVPDSCVLGEGVRIAAHVVLGENVQLGAHSVLHVGVVLSANVNVGEHSVLHPRVVCYDRVLIGSRCVLHAGAVLGSDGFGFDPTPDGWKKIPQRGTVEVGDDVEIGANACVDRGRFGPTRIGHGAKLDNLVHIGHNVTVEERALLSAQVGTAGSCTIGKGAILAGQVGVGGHIRIGDGARVGGQSGISQDLDGGHDYFGSPARPLGESLRIHHSLTHLPDLVRRVKSLEKRLASESPDGKEESR